VASLSACQETPDDNKEEGEGEHQRVQPGVSLEEDYDATKGIRLFSHGCGPHARLCCRLAQTYIRDRVTNHTERFRRYPPLMRGLLTNECPRISVGLRRRGEGRTHQTVSPLNNAAPPEKIGQGSKLLAILCSKCRTALTCTHGLC